MLDCQIPGPVDVRTPTIPEHRVSIGHLHLDRPVEFVGDIVWLSPFRARQRAILTVGGQRFMRTLTGTACGMADPWQVTIGGRRLLISAMTYLQTWDPPACGNGPCRGPIPFAGDDCFGWTEHVGLRRWISAYDSDPTPDHETCNPIVDGVAP